MNGRTSKFKCSLPSANNGLTRKLGLYFGEKHVRGDSIIDFLRIRGPQNLFYVFKGEKRYMEYVQDVACCFTWNWKGPRGLVIDGL